MADERKYAQSLGRTVKILRGTRTQREIAKAAGIPVSTLSKIEQARQIPRNDTFAKVARGLGMSVAELEQKVMEKTLGELGKGGGDARSGATGAGPEREELDLSGLPRTAALRIASAFGTLASLRNHIDNVEQELKSVIREFQIFASSS